ncbi:TRAP transporter small permease [Oleidesulfovibrio sp.]|uniref:TRAP transporter small permease n=1 Tax=Oleidesulfovibrio sp. TaxID=2909707 RepID=UPI003A8A321F
MQQLKQALIRDIDIYLSGAFLSLTVLVVIVNVILRYLFQGGLFWVEEVATTSFIWSVFLGSSAAYRYNMHIGIDLITKLFPRHIQQLVAIAVTLLMTVINGYVVYLSLLFIQANSLKRTPVLDVPAIYVNVAITVGFGLITFHTLRFLVRDVREFLASRQHQAPVTTGE